MTTGDVSSPKSGDIVLAQADCLVAEVCGEFVLLQVSSGRYFGLNETGVQVWQRIQNPMPFESLIEDIFNHYQADRLAIARDVANLVENLVRNRLATLHRS